jgi:hypothetical protein
VSNSRTQFPTTLLGAMTNAVGHVASAGGSCLLSLCLVLSSLSFLARAARSRAIATSWRRETCRRRRVASRGEPVLRMIALRKAMIWIVLPCAYA